VTQEQIEKRVALVLAARQAIQKLREEGLLAPSYDGHMNAALNGALKKASKGDAQ